MMQQQMMGDVIKGATPGVVKGMADGANQNPEMVQEMVGAMLNQQNN